MSLADSNREIRWTDRFAALDGATIAIALVVIAAFALSPSQGRVTLQFAVVNLISTSPFLLASIAIAAYASASGADNLIAKVFQGRVVVMILVAAVFGALSPFCSCGVIPIIAALLTMGVPLAPVMAFWLASPIMDPSMFVLTGAVLGFEFAVAKTIAAIGIGLLGGFGMMWLSGAGLMSAPLREGTGDGGCAASAVRTPKPVVWAFWRDTGRVGKFRHSAMKNAWFLGRWLFLAFLLESLMLAYVPAGLIANWLGGDGLLPIVTATLVGVPAYLNGFAALPLMGGLIEQGMAPGAALSFLVAGGVTSIPAAIAVWALASRNVFFAYLAFALLGSLAAGLAYQTLLSII